MKRSGKASTVLTVRIGADLQHALASEARRRRTTKSELARELLAAGVGGDRGALNLQEEARRQSTLVGRRASERDALEFVEHAADPRGWE